MTHLTAQTHSCTGKHCRRSEWDEWMDWVVTFQAGCSHRGSVLGKRIIPRTTPKSWWLPAHLQLAEQSSSFTNFQISPEGFDLFHVLRECLIPIKRVSVLTRCVGLGILSYRSFSGNRRAVFHCLLGLKWFKLSWRWQMDFKVFDHINSIRKILQSHTPHFLWEQC